jgi:hypothetical protein
MTPSPSRQHPSVVVSSTTIGAGWLVHAGCARAHASACSASTGSHTTDPPRSSSRTIPGAPWGYSVAAAHQAPAGPASQRRRKRTIGDNTNDVRVYNRGARERPKGGLSVPGALGGAGDCPSAVTYLTRCGRTDTAGTMERKRFSPELRRFGAAEAARYLGVDKRQLAEWRNTAGLPFRRIAGAGERYLYEERALAAWFAAHEAECPRRLARYGAATPELGAEGHCRRQRLLTTA